VTIIAVTTGAAAQHGATEAVRTVVGGELRGICHGDLAVGDGIPHGGLEAPPVDEEGEAMAAAEEEQALAGRLLRQGEALGWDAVRRRQRGGEDGPATVAEEVAEQGRCPVVLAEAAEEARVGDEAAPVFADEGGAREGRRERRQAEEDLTEDVVVVRQGHRRRRSRHWQGRTRAGLDGRCGCTFRSDETPAGMHGQNSVVGNLEHGTKAMKN